jgi:chromosome segregation ATPase
LTETTARLVVKDLVTFDGLKVEYDILKQQISALDGKVLTLNEVIENLKLQLENRNSVIEQKDAQIQSYQEMTEDLKSALSRERKAKKLYKAGSVIGLLAIAARLL